MNARPVYLDLLRIRLPLPGVISFAHRISGVLLFIGIPFALYLLELSLNGRAGFSRAHALLASPWLAPVLLLLVWSLCHHLLAGIRFLLMDIEIAVDRRGSRLSAAWVGGSALVLACVLLLEFYL
ncbi:succinate dehydrogenase, cytochrome b556 subunit [Acidihalobacter prosperus]|uniref:Succinate dehydrogenase cytochrome b556 subunit n=1 Tax=Acidihalobacter prosperus TaxID=160660 RepID=A0A1A6C844_9GAMM|nr:succinate dehydrogenase, cytochrome b556 subunit [Acidihalobacter prosperus]OBS10720.1 succinate dehydrogenase, cytochrome b556 subunit [Acidihalobacter prosperus]